MVMYGNGNDAVNCTADGYCTCTGHGDATVTVNDRNTYADINNVKDNATVTDTCIGTVYDTVTGNAGGDCNDDCCGNDIANVNITGNGNGNAKYTNYGNGNYDDNYRYQYHCNYHYH